MFEPGDVVECVGLKKVCACTKAFDTDIGLKHVLPVPRKIYRVGYVQKGWCTFCAGAADCFKPAGIDIEDYLWPEAWFIKITPSSEDIFEMAARKIPTFLCEPV